MTGIIHRFFISIAIITFMMGCMSAETHETPWKIIRQPESERHFNDVWFTDDQNGWTVARKGFIMHTYNGGVTWEPQNSGTNLDLNDVQFIDQNKGWIVGEDGIIFHTDDGGNRWIPQTSGTMQQLKSLYFIDENMGLPLSEAKGWVVGGDSGIGIILHTNDGGKSWHKQSLPKNNYELFLEGKGFERENPRLSLHYDIRLFLTHDRKDFDYPEIHREINALGAIMVFSSSECLRILRERLP